MNQKENANLIIKLREKGWTDTEINELVLFIETHTPTEEEVAKSNQTARRSNFPQS